MDKHPRGLWVLFFTEMWERFGYYLMIGIFTLYMIDPKTGNAFGGLGLSTAESASIYGSFIALVYLTPFIGGIIADQYLGYRRCIVMGGLLMAAGYIGLGLLNGTAGFYTSLGLIILGNGFFKPNISTLVGRLYPEASPLKDAGFNIFYMGINIGAFVCNFVAAILRNRYGWGWAFAAAGIGMLIGVAIFLTGQRHLTQASDRGDGSAVDKGVLGRLSVQVFLPALVFAAAGWFAASSLNLAESLNAFFTPINTAFVLSVIPIVGYYVMLWARSPHHEKGPIGAILAMSAVVTVFWMVFHQNGSTLTLWAEQKTAREAGSAAALLETVYMHEDATIAPGQEIKPESYWANVAPEDRPAPGEKTTLISTELFQSINPGFVVLLTPVVVALFAWLRGFGKEPSTPAKIAWGMVITAASTLLMVVAVRATGGGAVKASSWWLVGTYGIITIGELFLSPMGLSMVSKLSPKRVTALMMGGWFLATAVGNKLAGVLGGFWETMPIERIFWINGIAALAAAGLIAAMVPWIKRAMVQGQAPVPPADLGAAIRSGAAPASSRSSTAR